MLELPLTKLSFVSISKLFRYIYIFICFSISNFLLGQSNWTISNTGIPTTFNTYDFIVANNEVFAIGANFSGGSITPGIYKSTDNGSTWTSINVMGIQNHNYLYSASIYTGNKMLLNASSSSGSYGIYSSTDGVNWSLSNTGIPSNFNAFDFTVISPNEVYAVGSSYNGTTYLPAIYKTSNGGNNWTLQAVTGIQNHDYLYSSSAYVGSNMLINASSDTGSYAIYKSQDGTTWSLSNSGIPSNFNSFDFIVYKSVVFAIGAHQNGSTFIPAIYKSIDEGVSWNSVSTSGMQNHNYLYTASTNSNNHFLINASNNAGSYAIYKSESNIGITERLPTNTIEQIYPIPTMDKLYVTLNSNAPSICSVLSLDGSIIKTITTHNKKLQINVSDLPKGTYLIKVATNNESTITKFTKS